MILDGNLDLHKEIKSAEIDLAQLTQYSGKEGQLWKAQDSPCAHEQQFGPPAASTMHPTYHTDRQDSLPGKEV